MFSFLKRAAVAASHGASFLNISVNTRTLLDAANAAQANLDASGGVQNQADGERVHAAQKRLFDEIGLAFNNGMTEQQIREAVLKAAQKHDHVSKGAELALGHVLRSAFGA